jgi:hypothetical protein
VYCFKKRSKVGAFFIFTTFIPGYYIEVGNGHGVYAGLNIPVVEWESNARAIAVSKPINLMAGFE